MNINRDHWALSLGYSWECDTWGIRVFWGKNPNIEMGIFRYLHGFRFEICRGRFSVRLPRPRMNWF